RRPWWPGADAEAAAASPCDHFLVSAAPCPVKAAYISGEMSRGLREARLGRLPVDAGVRHGDTVPKPFASPADRLIASLEVAFQHEAHDRAIAAAYLVDDFSEHLRLPAVVLSGLRVAAVDEDADRQAGLREQLLARRDAGPAVVRRAPSPQDDVAVGFPLPGDDGG